VFPFAGSPPGYLQHASSAFAKAPARFSIGIPAAAGNGQSIQAIQPSVRSMRVLPADSVVLARSAGSAIASSPPPRQPSSSSEATTDFAASAQQSAETTESTTSTATVSSLTSDAETQPVSPVALVTPLSLDSPASDQPADAASTNEAPEHPWSRHREMSADDRHAFALANWTDQHRPDGDDAADRFATNDPDTLIHPLLKRIEFADADGRHDGDFPHHPRISRDQTWTGHHLSSPDAVPEPASLALLASAASILLLRRRGRSENP
jgi:hypothetical protein